MKDALHHLTPHHYGARHKGFSWLKRFLQKQSINISAKILTKVLASRNFAQTQFQYIFSLEQSLLLIYSANPYRFGSHKFNLHLSCNQFAKDGNSITETINPSSICNVIVCIAGLLSGQSVHLPRQVKINSQRSNRLGQAIEQFLLKLGHM